MESYDSHHMLTTAKMQGTPAAVQPACHAALWKLRYTSPSRAHVRTRLPGTLQELHAESPALAARLAAAAQQELDARHGARGGGGGGGSGMEAQGGRPAKQARRQLVPEADAHQAQQRPADSNDSSSSGGSGAWEGGGGGAAAREAAAPEACLTKRQRQHIRKALERRRKALQALLQQPRGGAGGGAAQADGAMGDEGNDDGGSSAAGGGSASGGGRRTVADLPHHDWRDLCASLILKPTAELDHMERVILDKVPDIVRLERQCGIVWSGAAAGAVGAAAAAPRAAARAAEPHAAADDAAAAAAAAPTRRAAMSRSQLMQLVQAVVVRRMALVKCISERGDTAHGTGGPQRSASRSGAARGVYGSGGGAAAAPDRLDAGVSHGDWRAFGAPFLSQAADDGARAAWKPRDFRLYNDMQALAELEEQCGVGARLPFEVKVPMSKSRKEKMRPQDKRAARRLGVRAACLAALATCALVIAYVHCPNLADLAMPDATANSAPATSASHNVASHSLEEPGRDEEQLAISTKRKRVIITGEGRSGSSLVGSLFKTEEWSYVFEPLKSRFYDPPVVNGTVPGGSAGAPRVSADELAARPRCARPLNYLCTAAKTAAVLEELACVRTARPAALLALEVDAATEDAARAAAARAAERRRARAAAAEEAKRVAAAAATLGMTPDAYRRSMEQTAVTLRKGPGAAALAAIERRRQAQEAQARVARERGPALSSGHRVGHDYASEGAAALALASGLYNGTAAATAAIEAALGVSAEAAAATAAAAAAAAAAASMAAGGGGRDCEAKKGIAVKLIRMVGRLGEMLEMARAVGQMPDLVIHLIRDPRAVLASRYSVGWGYPGNRGYRSTLDWATNLCGGTMADATAGAAHPEYMVLRYEDMAQGAEWQAEGLYDRLGMEMPAGVREMMRESDGCESGTEEERAHCLEARANKTVTTKYSTAPRDFTAQNAKWRDALARHEVKAVETGCREVFERFYPDAELLTRRKFTLHSFSAAAAAVLPQRRRGPPTRPVVAGAHSRCRRCCHERARLPRTSSRPAAQTLCNRALPRSQPHAPPLLAAAAPPLLAAASRGSATSSAPQLGHSSRCLVASSTGAQPAARPPYAAEGLRTSAPLLHA
ncbi:hypothetical protein JKP88DRAFT_346535 [Tribonema minus]|uniref:Uncharacterized protein n=1 Tax=Tribonema minus TaxID=303371 RepID=A0A836CHU1_9STRA|nr:hypothetical protein JKP88DRAFT_346535 [Tribonema minus]